MCLSSQLDHQQEPFKLCMHNLAHPTNNGNSQEWLLEREEEENEFRDQFITIVNKRYCFSSIRSKGNLPFWKHFHIFWTFLR